MEYFIARSRNRSLLKSSARELLVQSILPKDRWVFHWVWHVSKVSEHFALNTSMPSISVPAMIGEGRGVKRRGGVDERKNTSFLLQFFLSLGRMIGFRLATSISKAKWKFRLLVTLCTNFCMNDGLAFKHAKQSENCWIWFFSTVIFSYQLIPQSKMKW